MRETSLLPYNKPVSLNEKTKYVTKLGSIIYTMIETQINIAFVMSMVSCFVDQILRYLFGSPRKDIIFEREFKLNLIGYSNSDWAEDYSNRKSTLRFVFILNRRLISYNSKKQVVVVLLSIKVEYMAFSLATQKTTWL